MCLNFAYRQFRRHKETGKYSVNTAIWEWYENASIGRSTSWLVDYILQHSITLTIFVSPSFFIVYHWINDYVRRVNLSFGLMHNNSLDPILHVYSQNITVIQPFHVHTCNSIYSTQCSHSSHMMQCKFVQEVRVLELTGLGLGSCDNGPYHCIEHKMPDANVGTPQTRSKQNVHIFHFTW